MSRSVLVSGSSSGIGFEIANWFARHGDSVTITGRDGERLNQARQEIEQLSAGSATLAFEGDMTEPETIRACVARHVEHHGGLDVLVCNLGSGAASNELVPERDEWHRMLTLNLLAGMDLIGASLEPLRMGSNSAIVLVSSIAGAEAIGAPIPYGAAKSGLDHSAKALARRLGSDGVRVNVVQPGNIYFQGGTWDKKQRDDPEGTATLLEREVPLRRFGSPSDIAAAVFFLAGQDAGFITGAVLRVDGGQTRSF